MKGARKIRTVVDDEEILTALAMHVTDASQQKTSNSVLVTV